MGIPTPGTEFTRLRKSETRYSTYACIHAEYLLILTLYTARPVIHTRALTVVRLGSTRAQDAMSHRNRNLLLTLYYYYTAAYTHRSVDACWLHNRWNISFRGGFFIFFIICVYIFISYLVTFFFFVSLIFRAYVACNDYWWSWLPARDNWRGRIVH